MASPERGVNVLFYLGLTGGILALVTVIGTGAANHQVPRAEAPSAAPQKTELNPNTSSNSAETNDYQDGRGCSNVMFTEGDKQRYVTVPEADAARIQEEVNRGDFRSVDNLQVCGDRGEIILNDGVTASFSAPEAPQSSNPAENQRLIQTQLDEKAIDDIFQVVDKDGSIYTVQKTANNQFEVLEVIEDHKSWLDPVERIIVLPKTIRQVR